MTTLESNRCYACGKLFCCADCCTEHIKKKHPGRESKCPFCRSERLMVKNFDNQEFLCHVVFHHLPLRCRLCGDIFKSCGDLRCIGNCNRRCVNRIATAIQAEINKSQLSPETSSPLNKTPCNILDIKRKELSIDGDCNGNFGNFTSPPELSRNTSTPMHVNLDGKTNFEFKRSPIYTFRTPKAPNPAIKNARRNERTGIKENNNSPQNETNLTNAESNNSDSIYFSLSSPPRSAIIEHRTPLRSILSNQSAITDNSQQQQQEYSRIGERKFIAMQEISEEMGIEKIEAEDMDLTDVMCNIVSDDVAYENISNRPIKEIRDSVKRVRFSDQFEAKSETEITSRSGLNASDSEEFFEARQSISEFSVAVVDKLSTSAAMINRENERNLEKEEHERAVIPKNSDIEETRQDTVQNSTTTTSSSSRVVMMVVVEKNGCVNTSDLAPLIDSSLKKLESVTASAGSPRENVSSTSPRTDQHENSGATVVSVDSYMSVSTVERYSTANSTINDPQSPKDSMESSNAVTGGIFSAMAHAMRTAFRNFSGATSSSSSSSSSSKSISREHVSQKENPALLSSSPDSTATSSSVLTSLASALVPRPAKRSRDLDELAIPQASESVDIQNDIRSPLPKRPRGWYKIRAREPIARMRNNSLTSPRGVSSETQCFQQGSLSIGDTILPIPSRAHQATQTD